MHILVIEDDQRVAELVKRGLEEQGYRVSVAYEGTFGRKLALSSNIDLLITDIVLPGASGLELCKEIRHAKPDLPIIMLTALGTTDDKVEGFDSGANDYLVKPFDFRELHVRIRELLKRRTSSATSQGFHLKIADLELNTQNKTAHRGGKEIHLTPKEFRLLEFMMLNHGRVLTRSEIAEKVWQTHFDTGTNFIDVYINYLRKKIDKDFQAKLIHTKSGMGFIFQEA